MKIIRNEPLELVFPTPKDRPQAARAKPGPLASPPVLTDSVAPERPAATPPKAPAPAQAQGVVYIGSANTPPPTPTPAQAFEPAKNPAPQRDLGTTITDLDNLSLEKQLEYGRNRGVFTKLAISKDGVLVARPRHADPRGQTDGFATTAAATIKDFEEGIASLKKHLSDVGGDSKQGLAGSLRSLQQFTSKLNALA